MAFIYFHSTLKKNLKFLQILTGSEGNSEIYLTQRRGDGSCCPRSIIRRREYVVVSVACWALHMTAVEVLPSVIWLTSGFVFLAVAFSALAGVSG